MEKTTKNSKNREPKIVPKRVPKILPKREPAKVPLREHEKRKLPHIPKPPPPKK